MYKNICPVQLFDIIVVNVRHIFDWVVAKSTYLSVLHQVSIGNTDLKIGT